MKSRSKIIWVIVGFIVLLGGINASIGDPTWGFPHGGTGLEIQGANNILSLHRQGVARWIHHVKAAGDYEVMRANDSAGGALEGFGRYNASLVIN